MRGRLPIVNRRDLFAEKIISMSGSRYKVVLIWYRKIALAQKFRLHVISRHHYIHANHFERVEVVHIVF